MSKFDVSYSIRETVRFAMQNVVDEGIDDADVSRIGDSNDEED